MILKSAASVAAPNSLPQQPNKNECAKSVTELAPNAQGASSKECRMPRRVPIVELNEHLTCTLCKGYFINATTIIECLHSFCRSCIVRYLESNKYCPVCDVQVHKTKPLLNIRPDKTLQDIVYKVVPRLFQDEMRRCREFYAGWPESRPSSHEQRGETSYQHLLTPDEMLCISLMYDGATEPTTQRYLRCPAAVSMSHLQKLIRAKYDLSECHRVDILHNNDCLNSYLTLMDVAYIYLWRRKGPLALTYRIYENVKRMENRMDSSENNNNNDTSEEGWKEVQLRISENGEMSVTGIQDCLSLLDENIKQDAQSEAESEQNTSLDVEQAKEKSSTQNEHVSKKIKFCFQSIPEAKEAKIKDKAVEGKRETRAALQQKNATVAESKNEKQDKVAIVTIKTKTQDKEKGRDNKQKTQGSKVVKESRKRKSDDEKKIVVAKKAKLQELQFSLPSGISLTEKSKSPPLVLNHTLGLTSLSNNHPLRKHSLLASSNSSNSGSAKTTITEVTSKLPSATTTSSAYKINEDESTPERESVTPATAGFSQLSKPVSACTLKVSTASSSSTVKSTAALCTSTTSSTYTSPTLAKSVPTSQQNYAQFTNRVYTPPSPNYVPIKVPTVPKPQSSMSPRSSATCLPIPPIIPLHQAAKNKQMQNYKTLQKSSKNTNQQLQRPVVKGPCPNEEPPNRPAKFFKVRNNMPRFLGNPASGVKPMYSVQSSPEKDADKEKGDVTGNSKKEATSTDLNKKIPSLVETQVKSSKEIPDLIPSRKLSNPESKKSPAPQSPVASPKEVNKKSTSDSLQPKRNCSSTEIKRHSIVKIDPRTLKPISERAPETSSLSVTSTTSSPIGKYTSDLKINTSSVSIFNPIKLQQQSERKSPHSPINKKSSSSPIPVSSHPSPVSVSSSTSTSSHNLSLNLGQHMSSVKSHQQHPHSAHQKPLSFTPRSPFAPNLQVPTISPNQFLYGQPGFPYDPMMAALIAYHRAPFTYDFRKQIQQMQFPMSSMMMNQPQIEKKSLLQQQHQQSQYSHSQECSSTSRKKPNETLSHKKPKKEDSGQSMEKNVDKTNGNGTKTLLPVTNLSNKSSSTRTSSNMPSPGSKVDADETKDVNKAMNSMSVSGKQDRQVSKLSGNGRKSIENNEAATLDKQVINDSNQLESENQVSPVTKEVASTVSNQVVPSVSETRVDMVSAGIKDKDVSSGLKCIASNSSPTMTMSSKPPKSLQNALAKLTKAKMSDVNTDESSSVTKKQGQEFTGITETVSVTSSLVATADDASTVTTPECTLPATTSQESSLVVTEVSSVPETSIQVVSADESASLTDSSLSSTVPAKTQSTTADEVLTIISQESSQEEIKLTSEPVQSQETQKSETVQDAIVTIDNVEDGTNYNEPSQVPKTENIEIEDNTTIVEDKSVDSSIEIKTKTTDQEMNSDSNNDTVSQATSSESLAEKGSAEKKDNANSDKDESNNA